MFNRIVVICAIVILLAAPQLSQAQARYDWCRVFDFTAGDDMGWEAALSPASRDYARWGGTYWYRGRDDVSGEAESAIIQRAFEAEFVGFEMVLNTAMTGGARRAAVWNYDAVSPVGSLSTFDGYSDGYGPGFSYWLPEPLSIDGLTIGITNDRISHVSFTALNSHIDSLTIYGSGTNPFGTNDCGGGGEYWIRPFGVAYEDTEWGMYDIATVDDDYVAWRVNPSPPLTLAGYLPDDYLVTAYSQAAGAPVMAATAGTVTAVTPLTDATCAALLPAYCNVLLPHPVWDSGGQTYLFDLNTSGLYIVSILTDDDLTLNYIVSQAPTYVTVDSTIEAGCILGLAAPLERNNFFTSGIPTMETGKGVTIAWLMDVETPVELYSYLTVYETPEQACNAVPEVADCLNANPDLVSSATLWTVVGDILSDGQDITLKPGASIEQVLNLDSEQSYTFVVVAEPGAGSVFQFPQISLRLGESTKTYPVYIYDSYEIPSGTHTPNFGEFYTVRITNTSQVDVIISRACVSETGVDLTPTSCYLLNSSFDQSGDNWTAAGGATFLPGTALLPDDATITQSLTLPEGDYLLTVQARLKFTNPLFTGSTGTADVSYAWPGATPTSFGGLTMTWNAPGGDGFPSWPEKLSASLTTPAAATADLTLTADYADNADVLGIYIESVCITEDDGGEIPPPDFGYTCDIITPPAGNDLGAWVSYHWENLNKFFHCELMILLNKIYSLLKQQFQMLGYSARWFMSAARSQATWLDTDLFPYLDGHFRNMAIGQVTNIEGESGATLWDVLAALIEAVLGPMVGILGQIATMLIDLVNMAADLLFDLLSAVIGLILMFISQLLSLLLLGQQLLSSIVAAYHSATPTPIPGMPTCEDPRSSAICIGIWITDNTVFSGPGAVIIPLIVGIAAIHLLLWVVGEIKRSVLAVGQTS